jgi:hypothetical protein
MKEANKALESLGLRGPRYKNTDAVINLNIACTSNMYKLLKETKLLEITHINAWEKDGVIRYTIHLVGDLTSETILGCYINTEPNE